MKTVKLQLFLLTLITASFVLCAFAGDEMKPMIKVDKKVGFIPFMVAVSCNQETPDEIFTWDFGNGSTALGRVATTLYSNPGTYKVKLVARNGSQISVDSVEIQVLPNKELINNMAKLRAAAAKE
mgnify:CR=1 FL=1